MRILAIETSCDETAAAVVEEGTRVLSSIIASSQKQFASLSGVIPEQAARRQVECMIPVLERALTAAQCETRDLDALAVTRGPGLLGSLLVGTAAARTLAAVFRKPLIGVHHTMGHLSSTWLEAEDEPVFPCLTLSVSGGHTDLWFRESHTQGRLLGRTRDDAAGEAFDKGASLLGLPYPGGPHLAKLAAKGKHDAYAFPLPLRNEYTLDSSFSGLKTALKYLLRDLGIPEGMASEDSRRPDIAASYEHAICAHLTDRLARALRIHPQIREMHLVGGVSANTHLRPLVTSLRGKHHASITCRFPVRLTYCTDNAAMIASAGYFLWKEKGDEALVPFETSASLPLEKMMV